LAVFDGDYPGDVLLDRAVKKFAAGEFAPFPVEVSDQVPPGTILFVNRGEEVGRIVNCVDAPALWRRLVERFRVERPGRLKK